MADEDGVRIVVPVGGSTYAMMFQDPHRGERIEMVLMMALLEGSVHPGRIRDAWFEILDDRVVARVYTRNGGANRRCDHAEVEHGCPGCAMRLLPTHPQYLEDADDTFDSTYASVWFRMPEAIPPNVVEAVRSVAEPERVDMAARWREGMARLERGEFNDSEKAFAEQLSRTIGGMN